MATCAVTRHSSSPSALNSVASSATASSDLAPRCFSPLTRASMLRDVALYLAFSRTLRVFARSGDRREKIDQRQRAADVGKFLHLGLNLLDQIAPLQELELLLAFAIEADDHVDGNDARQAVFDELIVLDGAACSRRNSGSLWLRS